MMNISMFRVQVTGDLISSTENLTLIDYNLSCKDIHSNTATYTGSLDLCRLKKNNTCLNTKFSAKVNIRKKSMTEKM